MAKKEEFAKNKKKNIPLNVFRKGALCAMLGTAMLAGGFLVGCDEEKGVVAGPTNVNFYYGAEDPGQEGKVGDYYIETDDGDIWLLKATGWEVISNIKGPQGNPGKDGKTPYIKDGNWWIGETDTGVKAEGVKGDDGEDGETPYIKDGNWWIGETDTGVKAQGEQGEQGKQGYYVTAIKEVIDDAWGISSHFEFTLNDEAKTVVSTVSVSRLMPNYYYGATSGDELLKLIKLGAENIQIENDIELTSALTINHDLSIDLNNHKLTYSDGTQIVVGNGLELEFKDGEMDFNAKSCTTSSIKVQGGASLILDRVEYVSAGTNVMVVENATSVKIVDSHLTGAVYCVGTNALTEQNFGVKIEIDDCEFDTTGYEYLGETWFDTTPILINIPCTATIKDSKITGHRQAVIVRGGDVLIEDCELITTGKDLVKGLGLEYNVGTWGTGNEVAMAALVVGNDGTSIYSKYATNLVLRNTEIKTKKSSVPAVFAIGNEGEKLGVNFVIDTDLEENIPTTVIANDYVHLTFAVDSAKDLFNVAKEVYEDRNIVIANKQGFAPSIILTQDINEKIYLSFEEYSKYGFMAQQFAYFIQNAEEFEYNVNFYAKVSNAIEVAYLMEMGMPGTMAPFVVLENSIDMAEAFKMMGETTITPDEAQMVAMLNQYVVKSEDGYAISDMYSIYCSLPVEVANAEETVNVIMQVMMSESMPTLSLTNKVEFNDIVTSLIEMMMNQMPDEGPEGGDGMGESVMPAGEMPDGGMGAPEITMPPAYYIMPTVDMYLMIRDFCTADTKDNLVWTEGKEIVSVAEYDSLKYAIAETDAKQVVLYNDGSGYGIYCDTAVVVDREVIVDLNGCLINLPWDTAGDGVFHVVKGGKLTINDTMQCGTINGVGQNKWNIVIWADGGDVVINGGTYTNIGAFDDGPDGNHFDVIYASKGSTITINGGVFEGQTPNWLLNVKDGDRSTTTIIVKGGIFKGFNPANCKTEGEGTDFVAEGYEVVAMPQESGETWYEVIPSLIAE